MPYTMSLKYAEVQGVNYAVCSLCGGLNEIGCTYKPLYMVYDEQCEPDNGRGVGNEGGRTENYNHKVALCYKCYLDQWMETQLELVFPDLPLDPRDPVGGVRDGRVYFTPEEITESQAEMEQGKGLKVVGDDEYAKWEQALKVSKSSNGAETPQQSYDRLYLGRPAEITDRDLKAWSIDIDPSFEPSEPK